MARSQNNSQAGFVQNICKEFVTSIFGLVIVVSVVFLYTLSSPVFLLRYLIKNAAKFLRPDLANILNSRGNLFSKELFSSKSPRCCIVVPIVLQGNVPESEFYQRLTNMVNKQDKETGREKYPEYKQYVEKWFGFAFWKNDPRFDIRNHLSVHNPCGGSVNRQELTEIVEELLNKRFPPRKSPWEVYIVNNYDDSQFPCKEKTVMIMRMHHTLADGFAILYSIVEGLLNVPASSLHLPIPTYVNRDKWSAFIFQLTFIPRVMHDLGEYLIKKVRKHPFNVPDERKSWKQIYSTVELVPIQKIKDIKSELGVSFTSVMLAAVSASMSAISRAKVSKEDELSDRASFFIPLPIPGGHPNALVNHATGAQIDLPMQSFSDPRLRVRDCELQVRKQKASTIPWLIGFFGSTLGLYFSSVAGVVSANQVNVAGLTSFPASLTEFQFDSERKVLSVELAVGGLIGIAGVVFTAVSYGKNIHFSATAESSCLRKEELDELLSLLCEEIDVLHKMVVPENSE